MKKISFTEAVLTIMTLLLTAAMLLGGMYLIGFIALPAKILHYIGGTLLTFIVIGAFVIIHNALKFMLNKGE